MLINQEETKKYIIDEYRKNHPSLKIDAVRDGTVAEIEKRLKVMIGIAVRDGHDAAVYDRDNCDMPLRFMRVDSADGLILI